MQTVSFPSATVHYYFQSSFEEIWNNYDKAHAVIITDENISRLYGHFFTGMKVIVLPPGEYSKDLGTIGSVARQLLQLEITRKSWIIGVGGGAITDIAGFIASVYMRGIPFGFVPSTLLGMVDAAIGGKNGVNIGMNKNILGTITQPAFILYDTRFLDTLPDDEWSNGFAEIIKYGCIFDKTILDELSKNNISFYRDHDDDALGKLIEKCVGWKNKTVAEDEHEAGIRKLLNFGHTAAHAIENLYELSHGKAVGIGMVIACMISERITGLDKSATDALKVLLEKYHLPVKKQIDAKKVMEILSMDKKRDNDAIDYILLDKPGHAVIRSLSLTIIENALKDYEGKN